MGFGGRGTRFMIFAPHASPWAKSPGYWFLSCSSMRGARRSRRMLPAGWKLLPVEPTSHSGPGGTTAPRGETLPCLVPKEGTPSSPLGAKTHAVQTTRPLTRIFGDKGNKGHSQPPDPQPKKEKLSFPRTR
ncbi:hypothetical protein GWK47_050510 [Chionoecetes opilio]|uniref:Uncharacterized protein n=1 Tax=Chionoecetes opilio TaxID=41210 RepID=A0A8J4Y1I4_CHIOP|nr:hypothetical protein GWK47_050510 [Chionoecetes opilio]